MICKSKNNRDGITLMFVLSMIVLFLLMGTTFVLVANDFAKASNRRALASSLGSIDPDPSDFVDDAFYLLVRGADLDNVDSPLRTHSLLEDQYGYGFKGEVAEVAVLEGATTAVTLFPAVPTSSQKRDIDELLFQIPMRVGSIESIRLGTSWLANGALEEYFDREFIGRVISITSGNATGFSSRILQHEWIDITGNGPTADDEIRFLVLPEQIDLVENVESGDEIIVNGRDFSGTGVGRGIDYDAVEDTSLPPSGPRPISGLSRSFPVDFRFSQTDRGRWTSGIADGSVWPREVLRTADKDNLDRPLLDDQGLFPNRIGQERLDVNGLVDAFITHDGSPNEPYDLPDYQNMFLSGPVYNATGDYIGYIPSFHRDSLHINRVEHFAADRIASGRLPAGTIVTPRDLADNTRRTFPFPPVLPEEFRSFSFRPVFITDESAVGPVPGLTANREFYEDQNSDFYEPSPGVRVRVNDVNGFGLVHALARNSEAGLDVDTDNDGRKDAVWIDIGLPIQTDAEGRSFRPLVAYKVIDMDSQLNLNAHGRATEAFPIEVTGGLPTLTFAPATPTRGLGVGVPEISLAGLFTGPSGPESYAEFLYERYRVGVLDSFSPGEIADNLGYPGLPQFKLVGSVNGGVNGTPQEADPPRHPVFGYTELTGFETRTAYLGWPDDENFSTTTTFGTSGDTMGLGLFTFPSLFSTPNFELLPGLLNSDPRKVPSYASDFRVGGGAGDSFYSASDLESLLRPNDSDTLLSTSNRFSPNVLEHLQNSFGDITTHSFEIDFGVTAMSVTDHLLGLLERIVTRELVPTAVNPQGELIRALTAQEEQNVQDEIETRIDELLFDLVGRNRILSNDLFRSGRMGLNIVPEYEAVDPTSAFNLDSSSSNFNPMFRLISDQSKYEFAKQFYCLALIVCGMDSPADLNSDASIDLADHILYRTAIAQWAVNIVDFQDPDSIMTGFEFDLDPFDAEGWEADRDLSSSEYDPDGAGPATSVPSSNIGSTSMSDIAIVWGAERPELLITETFAHHERRTEDLATDNESSPDAADPNTNTANTVGTAEPDNDWDSRFVPQSSAFFEIFNPWNGIGQSTSLLAGMPTTSGEFSRNADGSIDRDPSGAINIAATVGSGSTDPVWRVGFKVLRADPTFERTLYFTTVDATPRGDEELPATVKFGTSLTAPDPVGRGEFLVVGSSGNVGQVGGTGEYRTHFGRLQSGVDIDNTRGIGLLPGTDGADENRDLDGQVVLYSSDGTRTVRDDMNVVVIDQATQREGQNMIGSRSFSLSDPVAGYPISSLPTSRADDGVMITAMDQVLDTPFDDVATGQTRAAIYNNGLTNDFRFAYLQRLADPSMPHDAVTNPYITIDTASFNLLAFNGIVPDQDNSNFAAETPAMMEPGVTDGLTEFRSAERGESVYPPNTPIDPLPRASIISARRQLFLSDFGVAATEPRVDPDDPDSLPAALRANDDHNFSFDFIHTLGSLNRTYRDDTLPNNQTPAIETPMGWMAFNNRPFMSAGELFNVPCLPPENITENYRTPSGTTSVPAPPTMSTLMATDGVFPYTMGMGGALAGPPGAVTSNRFDLLRDYLEVPSLFSNYRYLSGEDLTATAGTTQQFRFIDIEPTAEGRLNRANPFATPNENSGGVVFNSFWKGNLFSEPINSGVLPRLTERPPYRRGITDFRSPGKVNLNTLRSERVWDAVTGGIGMPWTGLLAARAPSGGFLDASSNEPTDFPQMFTTAENTSFVPVERERPNPTAPPILREAISAKNIAIRKGGDSSILRADVMAGNGGNSNPADNVIDRDPAGSIFFRNQLRQRMSSMATTRSSVFAIWITVGYFEVDQFGRVGAEVGSEIGEVQRDRAFYMFDRSVPMACEPGKNHNVDRGVLVRTIIN